MIVKCETLVRAQRNFFKEEIYEITVEACIMTIIYQKCFTWNNIWSDLIKEKCQQCSRSTKLKR